VRDDLLRVADGRPAADRAETPVARAGAVEELVALGVREIAELGDRELLRSEARHRSARPPEADASGEPPLRRPHERNRRLHAAGAPGHVGRGRVVAVVVRRRVQRVLVDLRRVDVERHGLRALRDDLQPRLDAGPAERPRDRQTLRSRRQHG
jgi:hypothetical protein